MMERLICLHSDEASLVWERDDERGFQWRHCGARVDPDTIPPLSDVRGPATFSLDQDIAHPLCPPAGLGWFGPPSLTMLDATGERLVFAADSFSASETAHGITLSSIDGHCGLRHVLEIAVLQGGAFRFSASVTNDSNQPLTIASLASAQIPLPAYSERILSWRGRHNAELIECDEPMPQHRWERVVRRGISGHGGPPGAYVLADNTGWHSGLTFALQLAWSGDNSLSIERDDEGFWHFSAQTLVAPGAITLEPGESYRAPDALLAISTGGRNGAMAQHHAVIRQMIEWPGGEMTPRPVHLNSWEAVYFNHDATRIERLAKAGAEIGIERFVLDDGWFKGRRNDTAGLGDWTPDDLTYPDGLGPLVETVRGLGLQFGLWVEPEMINPDSDLYRAHPDWALSLKGRDRPTARHQLVLDMRREDVRDHLFGRLNTILSETPVSYLKWDHNRDHAPSGGSAQTRGTYALLKRIRAAHPEVEIEGCSGGGGRSDAGLVPYVHRFWTSDNIDAVARIGMQLGFLAFLPPEIMGSHVGASPAHATGRSQHIAFRAATACMGHFGVELDPETLSDADRTVLAKWIAFYKEWRHILHGTSVTLGEGPDRLRWQAHGTDTQKLLFCIRSDLPEHRRPQSLPLPFAANGQSWDVSLLDIAESPDHSMPRAALFHDMAKQPVRFGGSWLAYSGLPMPVQKTESVAVFLLERAT